MRYFLPSFKDWLQTLWVLFLSCIWLFLGAFISGLLWTADTYRFLAEHQDFALLWFLFNLVVIPVMGFTYTHWFLWGKENTGLPWWLPSLHSWGEGVLQWLICFMGWFIPFIAILAFDIFVIGVAFLDGNNPHEIEDFLDHYLDIQAVIVLIFWILFVAECHLVRRRIIHWWQKRKAAKEKNPESAGQ